VGFVRLTTDAVDSRDYGYLQYTSPAAGFGSDFSIEYELSFDESMGADAGFGFGFINRPTPLTDVYWDYGADPTGALKVMYLTQGGNYDRITVWYNSSNLSGNRFMSTYGIATLTSGVRRVITLEVSGDTQLQIFVDGIPIGTAITMTQPMNQPIYGWTGTGGNTLGT